LGVVVVMAMVMVVDVSSPTSDEVSLSHSGRTLLISANEEKQALLEEKQALLAHAEQERAHAEQERARADANAARIAELEAQLAARQ
jgi:hypothetical protein